MNWFASALIVIGFAVSVVCGADDRPVPAKAIHSIGLIQASTQLSYDKSPFGTVFCVDPAGLFLGDHTGARDGEYQIVFNAPGGKSQVFAATLLRVDNSAPIGLYRIEHGRNIPALKLNMASERLLANPMVSVCGYGVVNNALHPASQLQLFATAISVSESRGINNALEHEATVGVPGIAGPILADDGSVVGFLPVGPLGVVRSRRVVTTPELEHFLQRADVVFNSVPIPESQCHKPLTIPIKLRQFDLNGGRYEVNLDLLPLSDSGNEAIRHVKAAKKGKDLYGVTFVPVPDIRSSPPEFLHYAVSVLRNGVEVTRPAGIFRFKSDQMPADSAAPKVAAADAISPPAVIPLSVPLNGKIAQVIRGGSGRFLIIRLEGARKLLVFDVSKADVTGSIPLSSDNAFVAAGAEKLVVVLPDDGIIQRWNLFTLKREKVKQIPPGEPVDGVAMGYASNNPLLLMRRSCPFFIDIHLLADFELAVEDYTWRLPGQRPVLVAASADGSRFSGWMPGVSPAGIRIYGLGANWIAASFSQEDAGYVLPDFDGQMLLSSSGLFTAEPVQSLDPGTFSKMKCIPTASAKYFLAVSFADYGGQPIEPDTSFSLYTVTDRQLLMQLPKIEELSRIPWRPPPPNLHVFRRRGDQTPEPTPIYVTSLPIEQRIYFIPSANLLVTVPDSGDQLLLRRLNIEQQMTKLGIDYLFVASRPPAIAAKNEPYTYQLIVKSKQGGVEYRVEAAPPGMKISPTGLIEWSVPADFSVAKVPVAVALSDKSGQTINHRFDIRIIDR